MTIVRCPGPGYVLFEPIEPDILLKDLVANACSAMPNGGKLTVATANVSLNAEEAQQYPRLEAGDYVKLTISDSGTGMDEQTQQRVTKLPSDTEPGVFADDSSLCFCFLIVSESGGHIEFVSEVDAERPLLCIWKRRLNNPQHKQ